MVALSKNIDLDTKIALRVRPQDHRYKLGAFSCSKSNGQASLRKVSYDEFNQSESCSKDPIGYIDGANLYEATFAYRFTLDPTGMLQQVGADNDPSTTSCQRFLQGVAGVDTRRWPPRDREAWRRGPHVFCGDCGRFENYAFRGNDGGCHICFNENDRPGSAREYDLRAWEAPLLHELTHCDQFKFVKRGADPRFEDPIAPDDDDWIAPEFTEPSPEACDDCKKSRVTPGKRNTIGYSQDQRIKANGTSAKTLLNAIPDPMRVANGPRIAPRCQNTRDGKMQAFYSHGPVWGQNRLSVFTH